jgi:hypothetical protein
MARDHPHIVVGEGLYYCPSATMNSEIETETVESDEDGPPELVDGSSSHQQQQEEEEEAPPRKVPITIVTGMYGQRHRDMTNQ